MNIDKYKLIEYNNMIEIINILKKCFGEISLLLRDNNSFKIGNIIDGKNNKSNDSVKKIDLHTNNILKHALIQCPLIRSIASEEEDVIIYTQYHNAKYLISFDPLDGSSNIDINITTGTIFAIYEYVDNKIKNGHNIILSGYCIYGAATQLLIAMKDLVNIYQLNFKNMEFKIVKANIKCPESGSIYSINEAYKNIWLDKKYKKILEYLLLKRYNSRWVGCLVADGHRTLLKGGFFAYPANNRNKSGKIRLLYEAYPFAHIFINAGGIASDGKKSILDIDFPINNIHKKTPIILSSKTEYNNFALL